MTAASIALRAAADALEREAATLRERAAEIERGASQSDFEAVLDHAAPRRLNIKRAARIAGCSERTLYRLAPLCGERAGRAWLIDECRLRDALAKRGEAGARNGEAINAFSDGMDQP